MKLLPKFLQPNPLPTIAVSAQEHVKYTPDYGLLQAQEYIPFFAYNELMQDHFMAKLLYEQVFYGVTFSVFRNFFMWRKRDGEKSKVFILEEHSKEPQIFHNSPGRIKGEHYWVKPKRILELDNYMQNTVECNRVLLSFVLPYWSDQDNNMRTKILKAYTYVGIKPFWEPQIEEINGYPKNDAFQLVKKKTPGPEYLRLGDHFYYSLSEYGR